MSPTHTMWDEFLFNQQQLQADTSSSIPDIAEASPLVTSATTHHSSSPLPWWWGGYYQPNSGNNSTSSSSTFNMSGGHDYFDYPFDSGGGGGANALPDIFQTLQQSFHCGNGSATFQELVSYVSISWWLDVVAQTLVGVVGVLINLVLLPVLFTSRVLRSVFNCLLTMLLIMETIFILATCFETHRESLKSNSYLSNALFAFVLYPLKSGLLYYSIYMATVMARERYIAIRRPVHYHNETTGLNPWRRAFTLALPVVIAATLFVIPIFFEAKLEARIVPDFEKAVPREHQQEDNLLNVDGDALASLMGDAGEDEEGSFAVAYDVPNVTVHDLIPSDLRFNEHYVLLYKTFANFALTMVLPFILLVCYNVRIISVLRRRRRLINRPLQASNSRSAQLKAEEARKAYVLLSITLLFMICHSARFVLGVHECWSVKEYQRGVREHCNPSPLWVLILQSVSNLLLTINSSLCSILYVVTSKDFQSEVKSHYAWFKEQASPSDEHTAGIEEEEGGERDDDGDAGASRGDDPASNSSERGGASTAAGGGGGETNILLRSIPSVSNTEEISLATSSMLRQYKTNSTNNNSNRRRMLPSTSSSCAPRTSSTSTATPSSSSDSAATAADLMEMYPLYKDLLTPPESTTPEFTFEEEEEENNPECGDKSVTGQLEGTPIKNLVRSNPSAIHTIV